MPVYDLTPLEREATAGALGTKEDPRFRLLESVSAGEGLLPDPTFYLPKAEHDFALLPISEDLIARVVTDTVPVYRKRGERIFLRKWPGIITALDSLFKGRTQRALAEKVESFYAIASTRRSSTKQVIQELEGWMERHNAPARALDRLLQVAESIKQLGLVYEKEKLRRSCSGSIPNELRWYPPREYWHWIYYEPRVRIPRNINPGRRVGWGSMEQWREPESHSISPKLIFTSSTNPRSGYKAFVVDDEWYVKLHGGTSQQYNYTGLVDPTKTLRADGVENNLARGGEAARALLISAGGSSEDLLHLVAGIYNSALAVEFLNERSGHDLHVRLPTNDNAEPYLEIAREARRLRDLHRLLYCSNPGKRVAERSMKKICAAEFLAELSVKRIREKIKGRKMKSRIYFDLPEDLENRTAEAITEGQERVDTLVEALYD